MCHALLRLPRCIAGATAIEYAFIAMLISIAGIAGFRQIGTYLVDIFSQIPGHL